MKETVYWTIEKGEYIGWAANIPVCVSANSFEEMEVSLKELAVHWHNSNAKILSQENPFEFVQKNERFQITTISGVWNIVPITAY